MRKKLNDKSKSSLDNNLDPRSMGSMTRKILKKNNIESPAITAKQSIEIKKGFWLFPDKPLTNKKDIEAFIKQKRKKFKLD